MLDHETRQIMTELEQAARAAESLAKSRGTRYHDYDERKRDREEYQRERQTAAPTRDQVAQRILKAVEAGKIPAETLGAYATNGEGALHFIPEDVRKSYAIPDPTRPQPLRQWMPWHPAGLRGQGGWTS